MALSKPQQKVWDVLKDPFCGVIIRTNEDLLEGMKRSKAKGKVSDQLGEFFLYIAPRRLNSKQYNRLTYADDMIQYAIMMMLKCYVDFDPQKSNNAWAYIITLIDSAFLQYMNRERKQALLKEELLERRINA